MSRPGVGAALVGYGYAGRTFHAPLLRSVDGLDLRVVVSSQGADVRAQLPGVRVVALLDDALDAADVDLVVIATPNHVHFAEASRALARGKHVVVDKPIALTAKEARTLAAEARAAGRVLSAFHNRRWDSDFLTLRGIAESGLLGRIVELESRFDRFRPDVRDRWRERAGPGAGVFYDLGPHLIDQALVLFGRPRTVFADLATQREGAIVTDSFHVVLSYPSLRVVLRATSLAAVETPRFAVHGTHGSWLKHGTDPQEAVLRAQGSPTDPDFGVDPHDGILTLARAKGTLRTESTPSSPGNYRRYYELLRDSIVAGAPCPVTADDAVAVMEILDAGIASADTGRRVSLR